MSEFLDKLPFEQLSRMISNIDRFDHNYVDNYMKDNLNKKEKEAEEKAKEKLKEVSDKIIEDGV